MNIRTEIAEKLLGSPHPLPYTGVDNLRPRRTWEDIGCSVALNSVLTTPTKQRARFLSKSLSLFWFTYTICSSHHREVTTSQELLSNKRSTHQGEDSTVVSQHSINPQHTGYTENLRTVFVSPFPSLKRRESCTKTSAQPLAKRARYTMLTVGRRA